MKDNINKQSEEIKEVFSRSYSLKNIKARINLAKKLMKKKKKI